MAVGEALFRSATHAKPALGIEIQTTFTSPGAAPFARPLERQRWVK
jgi:hypothetical protein